MSKHSLTGFIKALNEQKEAEGRVIAIAEANPEEVFDFIKSLPNGWDTGTSRDADLLRRVRSKVLQVVSKGGACQHVMQPQKS